MNAEAERVLANSWKPPTTSYAHGVQTNAFERRTGLVTDEQTQSRHARFVKIFLGKSPEPSTASLLLDQIILEYDNQEDRPVVTTLPDKSEVEGVVGGGLVYRLVQPEPEVIKSTNSIYYRYVGHVMLPALYPGDESDVEREHCLLSLTRNAYPLELPAPLTISVPSRDFQLLPESVPLS
jgi:hypothetical protein